MVNMNPLWNLRKPEKGIYNTHHFSFSSLFFLPSMLWLCSEKPRVYLNFSTHSMYGSVASVPSPDRFTVLGLSWMYFKVLFSSVLSYCCFEWVSLVKIINFKDLTRLSNIKWSTPILIGNHDLTVHAQVTPSCSLSNWAF